ncbi:uncharacterized protein LOC125032935 isoform X2 [Penaeus chinensis]|uniref:uncharacterized protein LOC125032935 isoform X2 n=1 Tax=Penaeus chinensis TaxID=139456 RepID=UPI001FB7B187|nr:uncharacterized protein LOC125032935 isoform X2 [Penaeus chinensis]XP_047480292.1 uncharacterized protein LOC125032935 isoform X2 [Penaeus chinensis]XP_047480293.1 uncharacterized protein LOC125032935 isoform X2 [Penaeus chinensis]XP_047480294.1 uncharacterized protein LOC125032935 isoform X2 [Penaeus chinensis]
MTNMSPKHCPGPECRRVTSKGKRRPRRCTEPAPSLPTTPQPGASDLESAALVSFHSEESAAQSPPPSRRDPATKKLYEITEPFSDPVKEKRRINAITAKEIRDRKKWKTDRMCEQIQCLNLVNRKCTLALKRLESEIQKLDGKLKASKRRNEHLQEKITQKEKQLQDHREKFLLFRGYLELIASTLDDNNPAKKLIANLLKSQLVSTECQTTQ